MSERMALCETFGLVVLPGAGELAFLDCVNGAADRGEGCPCWRGADAASTIPPPLRRMARTASSPTALHGGRESL